MSLSDSPTRREQRDNGSREARTVPTHDLALWHGAMLEVAKLDAKLAVARAALKEIADERAHRALDRLERMP